MRAGCLHLLRGLLLVLGLMSLAVPGAQATQGARRALLVGVSELPNQPAALWLQAPRNDVQLMRDTLLRQGFDAADITVLADGVPGAALPEATAIHAAIQRLLAQSRSGDFVLLYFSGHGTRLRDAAKRYQEPDGLAENFLARDVRGVVGVGSAAGPLSGGVRDVDVDGWIDAFLARNVFVWSVFDTCAAASMTRSVREAAPAVEEPEDDPVRWRGVRVEQLAASPAPAAAQLPAPLAAAPTGQPRARHVAFFASESHQVTPELRLPRGSRAGQPQGLLTWAVAQSLARGPATWRDLFDGVLALYPPVVDELAQRFPTRELPSPVAEGSLDLPLFGNAMPSVTARPVWRAERAGAMLSVAAGALDGLAARQPVRVVATLEDGRQRDAVAELADLTLHGAQLPVPEPLRALGGSVTWQVLPQAEPHALRVRVDRADRSLPLGAALAWPAAIALVTSDDAAGAAADVRVRAERGGGWRVEILDAALGGPAAGAPLRDADALRARLESLARLKWFQALSGIAQGSRYEGLDVQLEAWAGDRLLRAADAREAQVAGVLPLRAGERAVLWVRNASGQSVDLVAAGLDGQGTPRAVYPQDSRESNRFERGTAAEPAAKRFALPWLAEPGARLLVVATPATAFGAPRLFGLRPGDGLDMQLRVRGRAAAPQPRPAYAALVSHTGAGRP